jgi:Polyketide cyclase / dehydrase and lipid transport
VDTSVGLGLSVTLLVAGLVVVAMTTWLRFRWESHLVGTRSVSRTSWLHLLGFALMLSGAAVFLYQLAAPLALVLAGLTIVWVIACSLNRFRRVYVESATIFRCSPDKAFALLGDPRKETLYRPELERLEVLSTDTVTVGTVIRAWVRIQASSLVGLYLVVDAEITEYDPPHALAERIVGKSARARVVFRAVDAGTQVTTTYDDRIELPVALTGGVFFRREAERHILESRLQGWERARHILEEPAA